MSLAPSLCFFALGDFGVRCPNMEAIAAAMDKYGREICAPDFILGLGDNFYPVRLVCHDFPISSFPAFQLSVCSFVDTCDL